MDKRQIDIAWAGGLFEGEGCASLRHDLAGRPVVSLAMTDEDVVRRFHAIVERGTVTMYQTRNPGRKCEWRWAVYRAADVVSVLSLLWPHLGERRSEQTMRVMERAIKVNDRAGFCKRGHDLTNPLHLSVNGKTGQRHCRTCRRERNRAQSRALSG